MPLGPLTWGMSPGKGKEGRTCSLRAIRRARDVHLCRATFSPGAQPASFHALNVFFGQSVVSTVQQIVITFVAGSVLYITRRVSGTLILCMVLHAWIDFTTFAFSDAATKAESPFGILGFAQWGAFILAIVGVVILLRRESRPEPSQETLASA